MNTSKLHSSYRPLILLLISIAYSSCLSVKSTSLWDEKSDTPEPEHIGRFYGLSVLPEGISSEVWFTENAKCLMVTNSDDIVHSGEKGLHLKWDKRAGGCDWVGMGVGWDSWTGKDLTSILDSAAIQIMVRGVDGPLSSLPLAASLEDYSGNQAWIGFHKKYFGSVNDAGWTIVQLPLSDFTWNEFNADYSNVKQFIIQFEASGEAYFDDIQIVRKHDSKTSE